MYQSVVPLTAAIARALPLAYQISTSESISTPLADTILVLTQGLEGKSGAMPEAGSRANRGARSLRK